MSDKIVIALPSSAIVMSKAFIFDLMVRGAEKQLGRAPNEAERTKIVRQLNNLDSQQIEVFVNGKRQYAKLTE